MIGQLPKTLQVNGKAYEIRSDFRNILRIFQALSAEELSDSEKAYIFLKRLYVDADSFRKADLEEAYKQAMWFVECGNQKEDRPSPRLVNWEKDEQLIFPEINKVAGTEVRELPYMHWWTFMGYFQAVDRDGLWGYVLMIRQKRAKHKKLEKAEKEFYTANKNLCSVHEVKYRSANDILDSFFGPPPASAKGGED